MKVNRKELKEILETAKIGLTSRETIKQSNMFVFKDGELITFNEEIMTRQKSPLDFSGVVYAEDFIKLMGKFPEEEVEIFDKKEEIIIKGKRKSAGVTCQTEVQLLYQDVPTPEKWRKFPKGIFDMMLQASRICSTDPAKPTAMYVHVTPEYIEATDGFRLFRATLETGFKNPILISALSIAAVAPFKPMKYSVGKGWVHFKTDDGAKISAICSHEDFLDCSAILEIEEFDEVSLPGNLSEILDRAEIMKDPDMDANVQLTFEDGKMTIKAQKDTGWYKEKKKVKYSGDKLEFKAHPGLLKELFSRTRNVKVGEGKLKIEHENIEFVVALVVSGE